MANAFQDQLIKSGLVSKDKVNKANKQKHKQAKQQPKNKVTDADKRKQEINQETLSKQARDRELNRKKQDAANKNAIHSQIKQLVEMNAITDEEGETAYNFEDNKKIKQIYVTDEIRKQIINGRLAIVRLDEKYHLVAKIVADKIMQRDPSVIILSNDSIQENDEEDEYADYKVPDDLMW